jgi:hypothetical protein
VATVFWRHVDPGIRTVLPKIGDPDLAEVIESPDTMWYDRYSVIPGYQDSFGDNSSTPIGFRPNSPTTRG